MANKYLRLIVAAAVILGILLLAKGQTVWAVQNDQASQPVVLGKGEASVSLTGPGPGSVKPPPGRLHICENGLHSVGGMVTLDIKDLKPGYCVEAVLWNPRFQIKRLPEDAGKPLAHSLFLRIYYAIRLTYEIPAGDGTVEACYAVPPDKQAQLYFYNFYGMRFKKLTKPPASWDLLETRVDTEKKTACAVTQVSGVYALVGK
jgi:hypothetical protein